MARKGFILTARAIADLDVIFEYVSRDSGTERATAIENEFFFKFRLIAAHPGIGHPRRDLTPRRVLFARAYNWLIIYSHSRADSLITVRGVLHGSRDVRSILSRQRRRTAI